MTRRTTAAFTLCLALTALSGCGSNTPIRDAGKAVGEGIKDAGEGVADFRAGRKGNQSTMDSMRAEKEQNSAIMRGE